jgi:death-on-curing protein
MKSPLWVGRDVALALHADSLAVHGGLGGLRDSGLLESALARPLNLHAYGEEDAVVLAAAYAFGVVRNHPFTDGNKRTGFLVAGLFLELNGFRFIATEADVVIHTLALAAGEIDERAFADWLRENVREL